MDPARDIERALKLEAAGDLSAARAIYQTILDSQPGHPGALKHMARLAGQAGQTDLAGNLCIRSLESDPKQADVWTNFGMILIEQNRPEDAEKALGNALSLDPGYAPAWLWMASPPMMRGETGQAAAFLEKAIALDPTLSDAYFLLAQAGKIEAGSEKAKALADRLSASGVSPADIANLHYGLAYICQKAGDDKGFFEHLDQANRSQRASTGPWRETFEAGFAALTAAMTKSPPQPGPKTGADGPVPIFIVGLPRSGSTLLEQMLASHGSVEALGELPFFPKFLQKVSRTTAGAAPPASYAKLSAFDYAEAGRFYRTRAGALSGGKPFFTDKLPWNFEMVGPIAAALPGAKVIHITRNALDCGFSIYRNRFPAALAYCCDHADYAYFRRRYLDLMALWDKLLPDFIHHVEYEALVKNPEAELKKICDFAGLAFEPGMLAFHQTRRPVRTLSQLQVLKPLDPKSIGAAKKYQPYLKPLEKALSENDIPF